MPNYGSVNTSNKVLSIAQIMQKAKTGSPEGVDLYDKLFSGVMLEVLRRDQTDFVFQKLITRNQIIKAGTGTSSYVRRRIPNDYHARDFLMTEGIDHDGLMDHTYISIPFTTHQFGFRFEATEETQNFFDIDYLTDAATDSAYFVESFKDQIAKSAFLSTSNVYLAGGKTSLKALTSTDVFAHRSVETIAANMRTRHIKPHETFGKYAVVIHENVVEMLRYEDESFKAAMTIGNDASFLITGNIFAFGPLKYIPVNDKTLILEGKGVSGVDVYTSVVIGAEAASSAKIAGMQEFTAKVRPRGSGNDIYERFDQIVNKMWYGASLMNMEACALYYACLKRGSYGKLEEPAITVGITDITSNSVKITTLLKSTGDSVLKSAKGYLTDPMDNSKIISEFDIADNISKVVDVTGLNGNQDYSVLVVYSYTYGGYDDYLDTENVAESFDATTFKTLTI